MNAAHVFRRAFFGAFVTNAWLLACGDPIDLTVTPGIDPSTDGGPGRLPDGGVGPGPTPADGDVAPADVSSPTATCNTSQAINFDDNYEASVAGWSVTGSPSFDGGITAVPVAGGVPDHLHVRGGTGAPAYLERALLAGCDRVTVRLRFQFVNSVSFDLVSFKLGSAATPAVTIRYLQNISMLAVVSTVARDASGTETTTSFGKKLNTLDFYFLDIVVNRRGDVWATLDDAINTNLAPLVPSDGTIDADPASLRVGMDNVYSADNAVDLDTITVAPPFATP